MHDAADMTHFEVIHSGVQFIDGKEDIILAGLLFFAMENTSTVLTKIVFDVNILKKELLELVQDERTSITCRCEATPFCQTITQQVKLYCICQTPWIEGTTAKAIYGSKLKDFNAHTCCHCGNWFHNHCLRACGIPVPKRTQDFLCPFCKKPLTVPWGHSMYTNTCTSDNFLTILLLHSQQNVNFHHKFIGSSDSELVLKAALATMLKGNVVNGKKMMLDHIHSKIGLPKAGKMLNCFGTEFALCLTFFHHVWKIKVNLRCNSPHCPNVATERYPCGFVFHDPSANNSFLEQIAEQFPQPQSTYGGYCAAKFQGKKPPKNSKCALNSSCNVETGITTTFYECRGQLIAEDAHFLAKSPWLLPFCIESLSSEAIMNLPMHVSVFGKRYVLAGFTLHHPGHYTAGVVWRDIKYFYDGLNHQNLIPLQTEHVKNQSGSFAYYCLS